MYKHSFSTQKQIWDKLSKQWAEVLNFHKLRCKDKKKKKATRLHNHSLIRHMVQLRHVKFIRLAIYLTHQRLNTALIEALGMSGPVI